MKNFKNKKTRFIFITIFSLLFFPMAMNAQSGNAGIGVSFKIDSVSHYPYVYTVYPGSPAASAGVMIGDWIYKINGTIVSYQTLEQVANSIRGDEGTTVAITFSRGGVEFDRTLQRVNLATYNKQVDASSPITMNAGGDEFCNALEKIIDASPKNFQSLRDSIYNEPYDMGEGFGDDMPTQTFLNDGSLVINKFTSKVKLPGMPNTAILNSQNDSIGFYFVCYNSANDSASLGNTWATLNDKISNCLYVGAGDSLSESDYVENTNALGGGKKYTQEIYFEKVSTGFNPEIKNSFIRMVFEVDALGSSRITIIVIHELK